MRLCGRCWAHGTNWNVQTADCDITKGPARLASPAGGAVANPRLRIPPPYPLHDSLASGSCSGAQLRASGGLPGRPLLGASTPCRRATHGPLTEESPHPLRDPHLSHSLRTHYPRYPFTGILYPCPPVRTLLSTPHQRPCTSMLPTNLLPPLSPSCFCFSSVGQAREVEDIPFPGSGGAPGSVEGLARLTGNFAEWDSERNYPGLNSSSRERSDFI